MPNGWHRANRNNPATRQRQREYNSAEYKRAKADGQRLVNSGLAHCWRPTCQRWIPPGSPWHLGHNDAWTRVMGPECPPCNVKAAARKGNRMSRRNQKPRTTRWAI